MFQDVVCPHADSTRKWYTLPLSFVIHTSILIVLVVIPLMAGDVLPSPRVITAFVNPAQPPAPQPAPMVAKHVSGTAGGGGFLTAPIEAPQGIARIHGIVTGTRAADRRARHDRRFRQPVSLEPPPNLLRRHVVKPVGPAA